MATVAEHYENLLADYYSWMFGDFDTKVEANRRFFMSRQLLPSRSGIVLDLGAGSGFQSIALAQLGYRVLAVDLSRKLLDELRNRCNNLSITAIRDDMVTFAAHFPDPVELCVCMGDTLPHLESFGQVKLLLEGIYRSLEAGGRCILTFRDLTSELKELDRFIPVKSDPDTTFTCFLEYEPEHVKVHDLIYTRTPDGWELHKSWYRKLRIPMEWAVVMLKEIGFSLDLCESSNGMIAIVAQKPETA